MIVFYFFIYSFSPENPVMAVNLFAVGKDYRFSSAALWHKVNSLLPMTF